MAVPASPIHGGETAPAASRRVGTTACTCAGGMHPLQRACAPCASGLTQAFRVRAAQRLSHAVGGNGEQYRPGAQRLTDVVDRGVRHACADRRVGETCELVAVQPSHPGGGVFEHAGQRADRHAGAAHRAVHVDAASTGIPAGSAYSASSTAFQLPLAQRTARVGERHERATVQSRTQAHHAAPLGVGDHAVGLLVGGVVHDREQCRPFHRRVHGGAGADHAFHAARGDGEPCAVAVGWGQCGSEDGDVAGPSAGFRTVARKPPQSERFQFTHHEIGFTRVRQHRHRGMPCGQRFHGHPSQCPRGRGDARQRVDDERPERVAVQSRTQVAHAGIIRTDHRFERPARSLVQPWRRDAGAAERGRKPLFLFDFRHAGRDREAQDVGTGAAVGFGYGGDVAPQRFGYAHSPDEHAFHVAQRCSGHFAGGRALPDDAIDALPAESHAHHRARQGIFGILLVDEIVEGLPQMRGLDIQYHAHDRIHAGLGVSGRARAALARGQPVERQLLRILVTHGSTISALVAKRRACGRAWVWKRRRATGLGSRGGVFRSDASAWVRGWAQGGFNPKTDSLSSRTQTQTEFSPKPNSHPSRSRTQACAMTALSSSILLRRSHGNSTSMRPKWPYAAVFS